MSKFVVEEPTVLFVSNIHCLSLGGLCATGLLV